MRQSGGQAEITTLSKLSGLTRPTVMSYLDIFEVRQRPDDRRPPGSRCGTVEVVGPLLDALAGAGYRMSRELRTEVLALAGESR